MGGRQMPFVGERLPLGGMNFLKNDVVGRSLEVKGLRKDFLFEFGSGKDPVYAGNVCVLSGEYGSRIQGHSLSFVAAATEKSAIGFLEAYYRAKRQHNNSRRVVLNHRGEAIPDFRRMRWEEVVLPGHMGQQIRDEVETFFVGRKMYEEHGLDWRRGLLLAGSPGNGKTAICRAIATTATVPLVYCQTDDGDMYGLLMEAQSTISQNAPCIAIFEDAETLGEQEGLRSALLNMLDGLFTVDGVFVIATTNTPEKLDSAFTGRPSRFDSYYVIPNPGSGDRERILRNKLSGQAKGLPDRQIKALVAEMDGLSAACVQEVAVCALLTCFKESKPLSIADLKASIGRVKEHLRVSKDGFEKFTKGSIGFSESARGGRRE